MIATGDIIVDILSKIVVDVAAGEILEILRRILHGEDLASLVEGGNEAAASLESQLQTAGIDPATLGSADWSQIADLAETHFEARELPADSFDGAAGDQTSGFDRLDGSGWDIGAGADAIPDGSGGMDSGGIDGGGLQDGDSGLSSDAGDPAGF